MPTDKTKAIWLNSTQLAYLNELLEDDKYYIEDKIAKGAKLEPEKEIVLSILLSIKQK